MVRVVLPSHPVLFLFDRKKGMVFGINEVDVAGGFGYLPWIHRQKLGKNMSKTDIYKSREPDKSVPSGHASKRRRRRSSSRQ